MYGETFEIGPVKLKVIDGISIPDGVHIEFEMTIDLFPPVVKEGYLERAEVERLIDTLQNKLKEYDEYFGD